MEIRAFLPLTLIDFPGVVAATIFTQGCNRRCGYCHNPETQPMTCGIVSWECVARELIKKKGFLDGVVFSGGEPTIQGDLVEKMSWVKRKGFLIGMHTNGEGESFEGAARLCDYILLSHKTKDKLRKIPKSIKIEFSSPNG
jgi:pyruvate formate lyase activating enzyme